MNDSQFLALAWTQLIQVSLLIAVVWLLVKLFARQRPHLAYALWLLVLMKCLTPPVMSSPAGLMSQLTIPKPDWLTLEQPVEAEDDAPEPEAVDLAPELPADPLPELQVSDSNFEVDDLSRGIVIDESELPPEFFAEQAGVEEGLLAATEPQVVVEPDVPEAPAVAAVPVSSRLWKIWLGSAGVVLLITFARVLITLRRVYRHKVATPVELDSLVARLSRELKLGNSHLVAEVAKTSGEREQAPELWRVRLHFGTRLLERLRLRRDVRVLVTAARVGPAVVGFFRPLLILPQVVTQGRSPQELEPIIAHELLHVKRGDLGVGWLQVLVQSLWWFHPLVWLVNRFLSREAERCCDEAVVAELNCPPARYARCLLNVLEQKRNLTPIPACPGVKPVELTKQRMERIMKLGQGCRKRSPWWCWLVVVLLGVVVLPGEAANHQKQPTEAQETKESVTDDDSPEIPIDLQGVIEEQPDRDDRRIAIEDNAQPQGIHIPTKVYMVSSLLNRLRAEYRLSEEQSVVVLQKLFDNALNQVTTTLKYRPEILPRLFDEVHVTRDGQLIVDAAKDYQDAAKGLIEIWAEHGFSELTINVCVAERVTGSVLPVEERRWGGEVELKVLDEAKVRELIEQLQQLEHTRLNFLPKATVSNGVSFGLSKEVLHPLLTHYQNGEPKIEVLWDGFRLRLKPICLADGEVKLECEVNGAKVLDEGTTLTQKVNGKPVEIQIPDRSTARFTAAGEVRAGKTLAIWSPEFQGKHQRVEQLLVFITPQVKAMDRESLLGLLGQDDASQTPASSFSPIRPVPAAIARLADDGAFIRFNNGETFVGEKLSGTHHVLANIASDLRDQKQQYQAAHDELVQKLYEVRKGEFFDELFEEIESNEASIQNALLAISKRAEMSFVVSNDKLSDAGLSLETIAGLQSSDRTLRTLLACLNYDKLGFCTLPMSNVGKDGSISSMVFLSTRENVIDVSLALRARSIPVACSPDDLELDFRRPLPPVILQSLLQPLRAKMLNTLAQPLDQDIRQMPIVDFLRHIAKTEGIRVVFPPEGDPEFQKLNAVKIDYEKGTLPLGRLLEESCKPHGLTFYVDDDVPVIAGTEALQDRIVTMVYSARDLWPDNVPQNQPNPRQVVIDHVRKAFAPESWQNSQEFKIVPHEDYALFFIRQRRKVHEQIREQASQKISATVNSVDRSITVSFDMTLLKSAIEQICEAGELEVSYDADELAEEGVALTTPVTYSATDKSALWVLEEILQPFKLELEMTAEPVNQQGEQGVQITIRPKSVLDRIQIAVSYPIGDLLEKDKSLQGVVGVPMLEKIPYQEKLFKAKPRTKANRADVLIEQLEKALAWNEAEGNETSGTMRFHEPSEALVVRCKRAQHELIAKLLCERRTACGINPEPATSGVRVRIEGPEQARYSRVKGMNVDPAIQSLPVRETFPPAESYLFFLTNIPGRIVQTGEAVPRTFNRIYRVNLEIPELSEQAENYFDKQELPLVISSADLDFADGNKELVKVIYLPETGKDGKPSTEIGTIVNSRLDQKQDAIEEARKRGVILAILRCQSFTAMPEEQTPKLRPATSDAQENSVDVTDSAAVDPELWKLLVQWERAGQQYKRLSGKYRRFVYDAVFQVEKRSEGAVYYEAPDKGRIDIEPVTIAPNVKSQRLTPQGKPYLLKSDKPEIWIRNAKQIAQANASRGKFYQLYSIPDKIPDHYAWLSIFGPAGEFLGGLSAKEAVNRYDFSLLPNTDEKFAWIEVVPKRAADTRNWKESQVVLDRKTFLPLAIKFIDPAGTTETVYRFSDFKVNAKADEGLFNIPQALKDYQLIQNAPIFNSKAASTEQHDDENAQPGEEASLSPNDGPGPSVIPPNLHPIDRGTVQLRFLGPKQSHLTIDVPDRLRTRHQLLLPGRKNLEPDQKYGLTLSNIPGKLDKSEWPVPYTYDPQFHWTLEISEWNERTKTYLSRHAVPLQFTDEDLDQVASNNNVTKVVYLTHPDKSGLVPETIETLVSTRLDPGIDPIEEAKRHGTIVAVLRSVRSREQAGTDVKSDAGATGNKVVRQSESKAEPPAPLEQARAWNDLKDSQRRAEPPVPAEPKPDQPAKNDRLVTISYPVADLVVPLPGFEVPDKQETQPNSWGIPVTGTPISIPGPPHIAAPQVAAGANTAETSTPEKDSPNPPRPYRTHASILPSPADVDPEKRQYAVSDNLNSLVELIKKSIKAEEGWHPDGKASVMANESTLSLIVRARQSTHDEIAEILEDLRRKQDLLVTFECEVVTLNAAVQETFFEQLNVDADSKVVDGNRVMSKPLHLHDRDGMLIAVKELDGAELLASPKLTTFNGVGIQIQISGPWKERNLHYMIVPTVSEDRRTIDVKLAVNPTSTLDVLSKAKSIKIPDGESVLIEVTDELLSPPKRTGVPEVDKALLEVKKKELGVRTFVLLTPRIIIQEEEEELLGVPE